MEGKTQTIQKLTKNIITYLVAILFVTSFFSFEFLKNFSDSYYTAQTEYKNEIKKVKTELEKVKELTKNTPEYAAYKLADSKKNIAKKEYFRIKKLENFFGFKSFQLFVGEFAPWLTILIYVIYMLIKDFYSHEKKSGTIILHFAVLTGPLFYLYWIFQPFQDLSKFSYYLITALSSLLIVFSVYLFSRYKKTKIQKLEAQKAQLQSQKKEIATFAYLNIPEDKSDEMIDVLDKNL